MPPAALTTAFFERLFATAPEVRELLPADLTEHVDHVDAAIAIVIRNLGDLQVLARPLEELGAEHVRWGVGPDRLAAAHAVLLDAVRTLAGERWSRLDERDWSAAFAALLAPMIRGASLALTGRDSASNVNDD
jgi:hemoglobin-like flavoprotein